MATLRSTGLVPISMLIALVGGCGSEPAAPSAQVPARTAPVDTPERQAKVKVVNEELMREQKIKDVLWRAPNNLVVGLVDDGTDRSGYAGYVCAVLREHDVAAGVTVSLMPVHWCTKTYRQA